MFITGNRRIPVTSSGKVALGAGFGRSLDGIVGSNPAGGMNISLLSVVCCQVEVSALAYHSSRGVLPNVLFRSVIVKPRR